MRYAQLAKIKVNDNSKHMRSQFLAWRPGGREGVLRGWRYWVLSLSRGRPENRL